MLLLADDSWRVMAELEGGLSLKSNCCNRALDEVQALEKARRLCFGLGRAKGMTEYFKCLRGTRLDSAAERF